MRKIFIFSTMLFSWGFTQAQSIEEAKNQLYYERTESAKNTLRSVIAKEAGSPDALYWLAEIYLKQQKTDSAYLLLNGQAKDLLSAAYSKKESPLVYIGWAHVLLDTGKTADARKLMDEVLTTTKNKNPLALWAIARANIDSKNGDIKWALELLDLAAKKDKKNPEIYTAMGDAYRKLVDGSNAVISYDKALDADKRYAEAIYNKGKIYKTQNNPEIFLEYFNQAIIADSNYAPALYELYAYYFFKDVKQAQKYLDAYISHSDPNPQHDYLKADLFYVSRKYSEAIEEADEIIQRAGPNVQPRLYKLMAYSYAANGDSSTALKDINVYFDQQDSTQFVAKDYALKAALLEKESTDKTEAITWYRKAFNLEKDSLEKLNYMVSLADLQKEAGNREKEARWRERIYLSKPNPTNLDIYKWGMALYSDKDYLKADSVFAIYEEKYPDHIHGYLWRARSTALADTAMKEGLAVPHFKKLIEVASADTVKNKAILLTAYEYLGGYEANITKNYTASVGYFEKLLELDPENADARRNKDILTKWIEQGKGTQ
jgi:tetratricopeptide (TPR) repeat protein